MHSLIPAIYSIDVDVTLHPASARQCHSVLINKPGQLTLRVIEQMTDIESKSDQHKTMTDKKIMKEYPDFLNTFECIRHEMPMPANALVHSHSFDVSADCFSKTS